MRKKCFTMILNELSNKVVELRPLAPSLPVELFHKIEGHFCYKTTLKALQGQKIKFTLNIKMFQSLRKKFTCFKQTILLNKH